MLLGVILMERGFQAEFVLGSVGTTLLSVAIIGWIHAGLQPQSLKQLLSNRLCVWWGVHSYSIYLLHYPVLGIISERWGATISEWVSLSPGMTALWVVPTCIVLFSLVGVPLYYLVERPMMGVRLNWRPNLGVLSSLDSARKETPADRKPK